MLENSPKQQFLGLKKRAKSVAKKSGLLRQSLLLKLYCNKIWVLVQESLVTGSIVTKYGFVTTEFAVNSVTIKSGLSR